MSNKKELCEYMILTPHYDNGHNGGMWCAEEYPCSMHGLWKKDISELITTSASTPPLEDIERGVGILEAVEDKKI